MENIQHVLALFFATRCSISCQHCVLQAFDFCIGIKLLVQHCCSKYSIITHRCLQRARSLLFIPGDGVENAGSSQKWCLPPASCTLAEMKSSAGFNWYFNWPVFNQCSAAFHVRNPQLLFLSAELRVFQTIASGHDRPLLGAIFAPSTCAQSQALISHIYAMHALN